MSSYNPLSSAVKMETIVSLVEDTQENNNNNLHEEMMRYGSVNLSDDPPGTPYANRLTVYESTYDV